MKWECARKQTTKSNLSKGQCPKRLWDLWVCLCPDNTSSVSDLETTTEQYTHNTDQLHKNTHTHTQISTVCGWAFVFSCLIVYTSGGWSRAAGGMLLKHPYMHWLTYTHTHTGQHRCVALGPDSSHAVWWIMVDAKWMEGTTNISMLLTLTP